MSTTQCALPLVDDKKANQEYKKKFIAKKTLLFVATNDEKSLQVR